MSFLIFNEYIFPKYVDKCVIFVTEKKYLISTFEKSGFVEAHIMRMQVLGEDHLKKTEPQILISEKAESMNLEDVTLKDL